MAQNHSCVVILTEYTIFKKVFDATLRVVILSVFIHHLNADISCKLDFLELEIMLLHKNRPGVLFPIYICTFLVNPAHYSFLPGWFASMVLWSVLTLYVCVFVQIWNHSHLFVNVFPSGLLKSAPYWICMTST